MIVCISLVVESGLSKGMDNANVFLSVFVVTVEPVHPGC